MLDIVRTMKWIQQTEKSWRTLGFGSRVGKLVAIRALRNIRTVHVEVVQKRKEGLVAVAIQPMEQGPVDVGGFLAFRQFIQSHQIPYIVVKKQPSPEGPIGRVGNGVKIILEVKKSLVESGAPIEEIRVGGESCCAVAMFIEHTSQRWKAPVQRLLAQWTVLVRISPGQ